MAQGGDALRLALQTGTAFRVAGSGLGKDLDGDVAFQARIPRAIHFPHAAGTESGEDFVRAETRAGGEGHAYFTGTRRFSSSNQCSTRVSCVAGASDPRRSIMTNRPSGATSYSSE